jgi:uncharacterized cupin superfamily protein
VTEAELEDLGSGLAPVTEGWFVVNVRDAEWWSSDTRDAGCWFENEYGESPVEFPKLGIRVTVLEPGQSSVYHAETNQEAFLVLAGECRLLVEGEERPLRPWDFFHCPAWTEHAFVGAGDAACVILMVGTRLGPEGRFRCRSSPRATARAWRRSHQTRRRSMQRPSGSGENGRRTGPGCPGLRANSRPARASPEASLCVGGRAAADMTVPEDDRADGGNAVGARGTVGGRGCYDNDRDQRGDEDESEQPGHVHCRSNAAATTTGTTEVSAGQVRGRSLGRVACESPCRCRRRRT